MKIVILFCTTKHTMCKSNYFSSKYVFEQLIYLIDDKFIKDSIKIVIPIDTLSF